MRERKRSKLAARSIAVAAAIAAVVTTSVAFGDVAGSAACSRATALEAMTRYHLISDPQLRRPIGQLLCGAFAGPGSRAMAASSAHGVCMPYAGWGVFRYRAGRWELVPGGRHDVILSPGIARSGNDIVEKRTVRYAGESLCLASGLKVRRWHWNGSGLTAGPWKLTQGQDQFLSPDRGLWCVLGNVPRPEVYCGSESPVYSAVLKSNGNVAVCNGVGCVQNWNRSARVLGYGRRVELNGFLCNSETSGVTCTDVAGAGRGKGFRIDGTGVTRVGP
jgi:hypothetical protein